MKPVCNSACCYGALVANCTAVREALARRAIGWLVTVRVKRMVALILMHNTKCS